MYKSERKTLSKKMLTFMKYRLHNETAKIFAVRLIEIHRKVPSSVCSVNDSKRHLVFCLSQSRRTQSCSNDKMSHFVKTISGRKPSCRTYYKMSTLRIVKVTTGRITNCRTIESTTKSTPERSTLYVHKREL
jgi:hypothetical protein